MLRVLFLLSFFCCFSTQANTDKRIVNICFERWWSYSFTNDSGFAAGIEVEIIRHALRGSGFRATFHELPYRRCLAGVRQRVFDFTLYVDSSDGLPIVDVSFTTWKLALAVKQGRFTNYAELLNLPAPKVMISDEYTYPDAVNQRLGAINAAIVKRSYYEQNHADGRRFFSVLQSNRVDAVLVDKIWAMEIIRHHKLPVYLLPQAFHFEQQYMGYHKENQALATQVETLLKQVSKETVKRLEIKYLGSTP
ncbi:substrate-binding periplasmic protein [Pseudoalteromonas 'SMAR']|uniref:substrate-binding periplasmic protein n=1 Tax=Pseudoalteromonas 'SMAR' TaxID=3416908 RepID=UPI003AF21114